MADLTGPEGIRAATVAQPDILGGIKTGMDFAQRQVENEFKREELQGRQEQLKLQRDEFNSALLKSSLDIIKSLEGRPRKAQEKLLSMLDKNFQKVGFNLGGITAEDLMSKDPAVRTALGEISTQMQKGSLTSNQLSGMMVKLGELSSNDEGKDFAPTILTLQKEVQRQLGQKEELEKVAAVSQAAIGQEAAKFEREKKDRPERLAQETAAEIAVAEKKAELSLREKDLELASRENVEAAKLEAAREADNLKLESDVRSELAKDRSFIDYFEARSAGRAALEAIDRKDPFGDLSVLFNAIKVFDPGSVVRETEAGRFQGTGDLGTRFATYLNKHKDGTTIPESERRALKQVLMGTWRSRAQSYVDRRGAALGAVEARGGRVGFADPGQSAIAQDVAFWNQHKLLGKGQERTGGLKELLPQEVGSARKKTLEQGGVKPTSLSAEEKQQSALAAKKRAQLRQLESQAKTPEQKKVVRDLAAQLDRMGM